MCLPMLKRKRKREEVFRADSLPRRERCRKMIEVVDERVARKNCWFFQAEGGIRYVAVTGVQTCALPISPWESLPVWGFSSGSTPPCGPRSSIQSKRCGLKDKAAHMAQAHGENLKQAMDTLRAHKMRSALTVFGVVLGVSVIMLVAGLLSGFDQKIQEIGRAHV